MRYDINDLKLSGKAFISDGEWLDENVKIESRGVKFFEVLIDELPIGWIVMGPINLLADFTAHTSKGMQGKSVDDTIEYAFILDMKNKLASSELNEYDIDEAQVVLDKYKLDKLEHNIDLDGKNDDAVIIISTKSKYIFVQTDDSSIRICEGEVMILKRKGVEKLVHLNAKNGVLSIGDDKSIEINNGQIKINGEDFNPEKIISSALDSISKSLGKMFT